MRILVFSDVHGNLPALEKLLEDEKADIYISLGDVVNYGPWSNECVELVNSIYPKILLRGNHEEAFISGKYDGTGLAKQFFDFCYPKFKKKGIIKQWRMEFEYNHYLFTHTIDGRIVYPDSQIPFERNYIIGHSHHQSIHENNGYKLYAIGSVGQNRQYINRIDYMIIDRKMELKHLVYNEMLIISEMRSRKYPEEFINYYSKKQRA